MVTVLGANSVTGGYDVENSLRFNSGSSDYLLRTHGTNNTAVAKFAFSFWIKRSKIGTEQVVLTAYTDGDNIGLIRFNATDVLEIYDYQDAYKLRKVTNRVFRDTSAWYHIVISSDATVGTPVLGLYINGVQETSFSTNTDYDQNDANMFNKNVLNWIAANPYNSGSGYTNGYISEFCFIDGSAEAPTKFGEFDPDTPTVWRPINPLVNTFGTNGVYLKLSLAGQSTNAAGIGADSSGNANHYAQSNIAAIYAARQDTPSNNFCTMIKHHASSSPWALSNGNLTCIQTAGATNGLYAGSMMVTKGKWYWEGNIAEAGSGDRSRFGMVNYDSVTSNAFSTCQGSFSGVESSCKSAKHFDTVSGSTTEHTNSGDFADDDIMQWAIDLDNNAIYIGRNGTYLTQSGNSGGDPTSGASKTGAISTSTTIMNGGPMTPYAGHSAGTSDRTFVTFNFGNPPYAPSSGNADADGYGNFEYAPPSGYFAICSKNLAEYG